MHCTFLPLELDPPPVILSLAASCARVVHASVLTGTRERPPRKNPWCAWVGRLRQRRRGLAADNGTLAAVHDTRRVSVTT